MLFMNEIVAQHPLACGKRHSIENSHDPGTTIERFTGCANRRRLI